MSKKSDYLARAETCHERAGDAADRRVRLGLLKTEAEWRRLAAACYDTAFGPARNGAGPPIHLRPAR